MKTRLVYAFFLFGVATINVLAQGGDSGGVGTGVGDDKSNGGTCCTESQMNSTSLMLSDGNYTAVVEPADLTITNLSVYDNAVVLIGENDETGNQVSGTENLAAGDSITISRDQFGEASIIYLAGMQNFSVTSGSESGRSAQPPNARVKSPAVSLIPVRVINPNGSIVTVGVDRGYRVHYPVHGREVGRYDLTTHTIILKDGTTLETVQR